MPSKTEEYLALAQRTANGLTRYWESWTDYLTTASRLYKYPFADQLMIYAQRPDATACAEFDIWRNRMNRYVRRGSKGIALLDESSGFPRLHYVFDVSDTGVRRNSRDPEVWQYNDDLKQPVSEMLAATYGISGERVSQQLADVAGKLVADYWDNNGGDIRAIVDGSLLMDYDEAGVEMQFKSAAAISVTYTLLERCGFEPAGWFDKDDFQAIHEFSTPDSVYALGAAVSDMSREVLRQIERTVKTTIRRRNNERSQHEYEQQSELHADRGLSSPEPDPASAEEPAGQVRQDAPELSEAAASGTVQHDAPVGEPVPAPDGGGADGREPDAADHGAASETEPGPGQGAESDGMGAAHEQSESTGRGTGTDGTDLQLSFFDAHIPTEAEQIETIDQAESEKTPSAFSLSQAEIENELRRHGSGFTGGKQRIMALYQTQPDRKLRAKALAKEYGIGGHSHDFLDGSRGFVNHDWKGLEFDHYPDHQKITLKWAQVEKYIDLMIQSDRYLTDREKEHYTPPSPVSAKPDVELARAKNLIREFCQEEYDSEPDFSDLTKIGIAYTHATDEDIPIQVNVDLVGYRVERYLGEVLIDERQYESLEDLTETELESLDFSELVSVTDEELEHYHSKAEERPALLPLDAATEYNALKEQHPDALVGFEQNGQFEFYADDAQKVSELLGGKLLEKETALGTVPVTGFPSNQWVYRAKQLWQRGENVYLAGLNEDGTHHQTKYLRREDYLPLGTTVHMEGRAFRVDNVNFDKGSVTLQDASVDHMLCVTNDGRKIGLDVRLMNPMLPDDPDSKLNVCVRNVLKIWEEGKDQKLTQLLFCDLSTPKNDGNFNVYDDIRKKLVAAGVPENEIEFIHNADTEAKKAALFSKVRSGDVRVLLGSTAKMGAGTNVQSRLVAVHHLDVGWKPSDMTQRNGRIIRQGNMNKEVKVFNYVTEGTFDSYLFQTLENKQRFISQIMTSKSPVRSCEDVDEQALSYAEIKALCAGNPLIKEKMDLDVQVAKLKVLKADHQSQKFRLEDKLLTKFPADIRETNAYIAGVKADAQLAAAHPQVQEGFCGMTIRGVTYDEKKTAGERLVLACSELPNAEEKVIGSYRGFELSLRFDTFRSEYQAILKGQRRYPVALGTDPLGNIIRLDNSLNNFPERITAAENELDTLHQQQAAAQIEVEKPFPQEEELAEKSARLAELNAQLDVDEKSHEPEQDEEEQENVSRRPSVLAALDEKKDEAEPVRPFKSYLDKDGDAR